MYLKYIFRINGKMRIIGTNRILRENGGCIKKILIVDDDRDLSELTQSVLKQAGYEVIVSHDSLSGIDMAKK